MGPPDSLGGMPRAFPYFDSLSAEDALIDRVCERLDTAHVRIVRIHRCRARFGLGILNAEIGGPFR